MSDTSNNTLNGVGVVGCFLVEQPGLLALSYVFGSDNEAGGFLPDEPLS